MLFIIRIEYESFFLSLRLWQIYIYHLGKEKSLTATVEKKNQDEKNGRKNYKIAVAMPKSMNKQENQLKRILIK